jgi:uncharacterized membrane protein (UPF0136 family)
VIAEAARIYLFVFGALTFAGGIMGFVKARSRASLVAGAIPGALLVVAGYLSGRTGFLLGLAVSLMLTGRFVAAFGKSKKMMPAGMMVILGLLGVGLTAAAVLVR